MAVLDASAAIFALVRRESSSARAKLVGYQGLHCPHLIDIEYVNALRNLVLRTDITLDDAEIATLDFIDLSITRYPHTRLLDRIWQLRQIITPYDAAYVALAELLKTPLITSDRRLARAATGLVEIDLFED